MKDAEVCQQKKTFKYINTIHCLYIRGSLLAILCVYCVNHRRVLLFSPPKWCSTIQRAKAKRCRISPCFQTVFHGYLIPNVTRADAFGRVSWQCNTSHLVPLTQTHRFAPNPLTGGCFCVAARRSRDNKRCACLSRRQRGRMGQRRSRRKQDLLICNCDYRIGWERLGHIWKVERLCETTAKWTQMLPFCLRTSKWHRSHNTHTRVLLRNTKQLTKFWELSRNSEMSRINKRAEINKYSEKTWCAYFNPLQIFNPVKSNSCGQRKLSSHGNSGCIKLFLQSLTHTLGYIEDNLTFMATLFWKSSLFNFYLCIIMYASCQDISFNRLFFKFFRSFNFNNWL